MPILLPGSTQVSEAGTFTQAPALELPFAPREQLYLNNERLLIADAFAGKVAVIDVPSRSIIAQHDSAGQNVRGLALAPNGKRVRMTMQRMDSSRPTTHEEIFWGGVLQNLMIEVVVADLQMDDVDWYQQNQHLGFPSFGAGDPDAMVYTQDGRTLIALAGVHKLAIRPSPNELVRQLDVGRRPVDIAWDQAAERAIVACQMDDSISIVDVKNLKVTAQIPLGPAMDQSLADRGEALFYDATLSLERRPWDASEIRRALLRHPAMTAQVVAGIHWQALRLWWKGVPLVPRITPDGVGERAAYAAGTASQADSVVER
jgi:hypothetical protein